jgi:hypothetical protein
MAFDGNDATLWSVTSGTTGWLKIDFGLGVTKTVAKYTLLGPVTYSPTAWDFQGSNDVTGVAWDTLDTRSGRNITTRQTYTFANTTGYRYYRFNVTAGGTYCETSTLQMMESLGVKAEAKVRDESGNVTTLSPHNFLNMPEDVVKENEEVEARVSRAVRQVAP